MTEPSLNTQARRDPGDLGVYDAHEWVHALEQRDIAKLRFQTELLRAGAVAVRAGLGVAVFAVILGVFWLLSLIGEVVGWR
jgi:hypothetical protein